MELCHIIARFVTKSLANYMFSKSTREFIQVKNHTNVSIVKNNFLITAQWRSIKEDIWKFPAINNFNFWNVRKHFSNQLQRDPMKVSSPPNEDLLHIQACYLSHRYSWISNLSLAKISISHACLYISHISGISQAQSHYWITYAEFSSTKTSRTFLKHPQMSKCQCLSYTESTYIILKHPNPQHNIKKLWACQVSKILTIKAFKKWPRLNSRL